MFVWSAWTAQYKHTAFSWLHRQIYPKLPCEIPCLYTCSIHHEPTVDGLWIIRRWTGNNLQRSIFYVRRLYHKGCQSITKRYKCVRSQGNFQLTVEINMVIVLLYPVKHRKFTGGSSDATHATSVMLQNNRGTRLETWNTLGVCRKV